MNISIFNKDYWLRRSGAPKNVKGYITSSYEDYVVSLNVHPLSSDQMQALPEGQRKVKRLEAHGDAVLTVADESTHRKGDLLYYQGNWYECVSAQGWDHTELLSHLNYQFVLVPSDASGAYDLAPPNLGPGEKMRGARL